VVACLSGFYDYGLREIELLEYSPVANVCRPRGPGKTNPTSARPGRLDRPLTAAEFVASQSSCIPNLAKMDQLGH